MVIGLLVAPGKTWEKDGFLASQAGITWRSITFFD
jgi:hypothetical protein